MRRWLPGGVALAASLVALRAASGCSGDGGTQPLVDSGPELTVPDAARPRDAAPDAKDAAPTPGELEGWVRWDDYDPKCNFSIPSERKYLPEPFEWEPCQDTDVTRKLACRRIKKKWEGLSGRREFIAPDTVAFSRAGGALVLATLQYHGRNAVYLMSEIDGPSLVAVRGSLDGSCVVSGHSGGGERYTFAVSERVGPNDLINPPAAIGGDLGSLKPRLLVKKPPTTSIFLDTFAAGNLGFIMNGPGPLEVYSWDTPPTLQRSLSGHGRYSFVEVRDDYFFYAADQASPTERIWTPEGGDQHLLGDGADRSRAAADLNTDGVDWVWAEGEGRTTGTYPVVKVVTSPFTRDASKLQKRVLRTDLGQGMIAASRFAVGHGFAGHFGQRPNGDEGVMIVKLADGAGWFLPGPNGAPVIFQHALAFTRDEVFTLVRDEHGTNVYRVRLDSLGAFALPPAN